jgi:hypothetical protein
MDITQGKMTDINSETVLIHSDASLELRLSLTSIGVHWVELPSGLSSKAMVKNG